MAKRRQKKEIEPVLSSITSHFSFARWRSWLPQALLIVAAGLWVFSPAFSGGWLWDDDRYVYQNQIIQNPDGFWKVWVTEDWQGNYYPLNAFVAWLQWNWWGDDTLGYHLTNVFLHLASAFLVWRVLARLGLRLAWVGALLFTVHPVMVESVAWISELKNTLSLPPLLLAILAWLDWRDSREARFYRNALLWFLISLLAKTSGTMLPLVLLGHAWWKTGTITRDDLRAVVPFFVVALLPGLLTLFPGHGGNTASLPTHLDAVAAVVAVGRSSYFLLGKSLLPINLLPDYPSLTGDLPTWLDLLAWLALVILALLLWQTRNGWGRNPLFGLGFFFINLVPVLVFVLLNYSTMNWSMDHLLYLPIIGLIGMAVGGMDWMELHLAPAQRMAERIVIAAGIVLMAWGSHAYAGWFRNTETLWTNTLERYPTSWHGTTNLSADMIEKGRTDEAMKYALMTLALRPDLAISHYNLGVALQKSGQVDAAVDQYRETLRIEPGNPKAIIDLGSVLYKKGNKAESIALFQAAVKGSPDVAQLRYNLGSDLLQSGDIPGAIEQLQAALALDVNLAPAHENLGSALAQTGHPQEAIEQFEAAIEINPGYVIARNNLALALVQTGHVPEAIEQFKQVLETDPDNAKARDSLAKLEQFQKSQPVPSRP